MGDDALGDGAVGVATAIGGARTAVAVGVDVAAGAAEIVDGFGAAHAATSAAVSGTSASDVRLLTPPAPPQRSPPPSILRSVVDEVNNQARFRGVAAVAHQVGTRLDAWRDAECRRDALALGSPAWQEADEEVRNAEKALHAELAPTSVRSAE